ncbi:MAG: hypothetical protein S4CHLAM7_06860 [Chlamydiae bacterium]|nr:hypothetical protein [Chlamydiota bacterium]
MISYLGHMEVSKLTESLRAFLKTSEKQNISSGLDIRRSCLEGGRFVNSHLNVDKCSDSVGFLGSICTLPSILRFEKMPSINNYVLQSAAKGLGSLRLRKLVLFSI